MPSLLRLFVVIALVCSAFAGGPVYSKVIDAEIEHKEFLPPVPAGFQAGASLDAPLPAVRVEWFPVPDWMAGTWQKEGDQETFEEDFTSGRQQQTNFWLSNRVSLSFGHQMDALNTVWHAEVLPFRADGNRQGGKDRRYVIDMNCNRSTPQFVSLRFHSVVAAVDGRGRVQGSRQQEEIVNFSPGASPGSVSSESSTKTFTDRGQPLYLTDSHTIRTRTAPFRQVDFLNGIDLHRSFIEFLNARNMANRIPQAQ